MTTAEDVRVVEFDPKYAGRFAELNYQWIEESYGVEAHDHDVLDHPFDVIIRPGGQVFFALVENDVAGTVAMIPSGEDTFELTKMAVDPAFRGRGLSNLLMQACIDFTRSTGRKKIFLESNTKQVAAIKLYRKFKFEETPPDPNSQYVRSNIRMELIV